MGQQTYREFAPPIEAATQQRSLAIPTTISNGEAAYCRARADEEFVRAAAATHPAARAAHLEMAVRYLDRALAAS
jgi:hypothetical protein